MGGCSAGSLSISPLPSGGGPLFCAFLNVVVYPEFRSSPSFFQLVVVADSAFSVDDHSTWHQPGARTHREVQPDLRLVHRQLIPLHALCQVGLADGVFNKDKKLCLRLLGAASRA